VDPFGEPEPEPLRMQNREAPRPRQAGDSCVALFRPFGRGNRRGGPNAEESRLMRRFEDAETQQSVVLSLLENALDYFLSSAEYATQDNIRSLKYSLLHAVASIELALKARLFKEHWSLIFTDVDKADMSALKSGDFKSADSQTVIERLRKIANVQISKGDLEDLNELRKVRNFIQHFALRINKPQVSSLIAKGFNFLVNFCDRELPEVIGGFDDLMQKIKDHLHEIDGYIAVRLEDVRPQLDNAEFLFRCPECRQDTLCLGAGEPNCPFCGLQIEPTELAQNITESDVEECPECGEETLAFRLMSNEDGYDLCTACGYREEWHSSCPQCGKLNIHGPLCRSCMGEPQED